MSGSLTVVLIYHCHKLKDVQCKQYSTVFEGVSLPDSKADCYTIIRKQTKFINSRCKPISIYLSMKHNIPSRMFKQIITFKGLFNHLDNSVNLLYSNYAQPLQKVSFWCTLRNAARDNHCLPQFPSCFHFIPNEETYIPDPLQALGDRRHYKLG
jgi:hypothetical protein